MKIILNHVRELFKSIVVDGNPEEVADLLLGLTVSHTALLLIVFVLSITMFVQNVIK